jgi:hypothetical protein
MVVLIVKIQIDREKAGQGAASHELADGHEQMVRRR